ncbi:MAG TPA: CHASE2 domain-containing protein [Methylomirabilota bacterium]|nr:CHASE2 domain-containing protein [Methylomirabilota bacterium]
MRLRATSLRLLAGGLIGLAATVGAGAAATTVVIDTYERRLLDLRTELFARRERADGRIVAVVIDQKSLDAIAARPDRGGLDHGWPWPRDYYAAVVAYLFAAGARAVGIDLVLSEPSVYTRLGVAEDDAALAEAIEAEPVVLAAMLTRERAGAASLADVAWPAVLREQGKAREVRGLVPDLNRASLPVEPLAGAARWLGWIGFEPDVDGVCRSIRPAAGYAPQGSDTAVEVPAFAVALAEAAGADVQTRPRRPAGERLVVDGRLIPLDEDGRILLRFHGGERTYRDFSFASVLRSAKRHAAGLPVDDASPADFRGKIVIVGANAAGLLDLRATPVGPALPGYAIHATALDNLLAGNPLSRLPRATRAALVTLAGPLCGVLVAAAARPRESGLAALALALAHTAGALWAFAARGVWVDLLPPLMALGLAYAGTSGYLYVTEGRRQRFLRDAFSRYLSPAFVERLVTDPRRLALGGESRPVTVLFADVVGFTTLSEGREPAELVRLMNECFTELTDVIQARGGTVDKFIGDAIMAFWNAPADLPDHPRRAALAAREMLAALDALRARWLAEGRPAVDMRIGLATGPALVGNVGSRSKFNYTAMGDTVNLASRLEGAAKVYHTRTLVAASTATAADGVRFRELDWLQVKGRSEPVPVFEILPADVDITREDVHRHYAEGLAAYRARRFDDALARFEKALATDPDDGPSGEMHARCIEYLKQPPPPEWRGEHVLTSK